MTYGIRNEVARKLVPLVHYVAAQVARRVPAHVQKDELVANGMLGLALALQKYDPARADLFKTYAEFRIRGAILDELRRRDVMSRDARAEAKRCERAAGELRNRLGREPAHDEVSAEAGIDLDRYHGLQRRAQEGWSVQLSDAMVADGHPDPAELLQNKELRQRVLEELQALPERQRQVIWLYYFQELPLQDIGDVLGVSASRVCQIRGEAVTALQRQMA